MNKKLNCIMLVDDSPDDNFFHEREIKKADLANIVITKVSAKKALDYLKSKEEPRSDLIFLDINMPGMNGWEFLEEYTRLDNELHRGVIIVMLTTSDNSDDLARAKKWGIVSDYITKPLTRAIMKDIADKYFLSA
jgi:CheY-like chemotaxis protein